MNGLRHSTRAFASAFVALLAMLMVSTVVLAAEATPGSMTATMTMSGTDEPIPCEDTGKPVCAPHCAVLCQAMIVEPMALSLPVVGVPQTYRYSETPLTPIQPEAEDPPPR